MLKRKTDRDGLYRRPNSPYWWASYTDAEGRRVRRGTGTYRRYEAEAMLAEFKAHTHKARIEGKEPERFLHECVLAYIDAHPEKRSLERDSYSTKHLYRVLGAQRVLNNLKATDIQGYIKVRRAEGASAGMINRELGLLSAAINWCRHSLEWSIPNPAEGQCQQEPPGRDRWLTQEEAARLIGAAAASRASPYLVDFIILALHTGMRSGEMLGLEWSRVDLSQGWILLGAQHQKSGKVSRIPLNRTAREALLSRARFRASCCPGSPWVFCDRQARRIASIKKSFAAACLRSGIEDCTPHDLRRTCGSWLAQAGVPIQEISKLLRHADIRVTAEIYAHLLPDQLQATVRVLDRDKIVTFVTPDQDD